MSYPATKYSGADWLGDVPEHWELRRTKTLLKQRTEKGHPNEPLLAATQTKGVVRKDQYENRTVLAMKDLHLLKLVRVADFVISLRSFQGGIEYARERGIISPAYTVLFPVQADHHGFLAHLFKSAPYVENLSLFVTGIRQGQNIDYARLARSRLPLPPSAERRAIVRFLDHADRRLQRYIRAKERLIELLEEQKQAIIHQAVTGQIDVRTGQPYPAYKDCGVEWLREVPAHWEARRLKYLLRETDYRSESGAEPLLRVSQYTGVTERKAGLVATGERETRASSLVGYRIVERNELAVNIMLAWNGSMGVAPLRGIVSPAYCVYRFDKKAQPWYFHYLLRSQIYKAYIKTVSTGVVESRLRLYTNDLYRLYGLLPPISEQKAIVSFLAQAIRAAGHAVGRTRKQLDLVRDYRSRLMADVVTGKLDVREAAASIPEVDSLDADDTQPQVKENSATRTKQPVSAAPHP